MTQNELQHLSERLAIGEWNLSVQTGDYSKQSHRGPTKDHILKATNLSLWHDNWLNIYDTDTELEETSESLTLRFTAPSGNVCVHVWVPRQAAVNAMSTKTLDARP